MMAAALNKMNMIDWTTYFINATVLEMLRFYFSDP